MDDVAVLLLKKVKDIPEDALVDISGAKVDRVPKVGVGAVS